MSLLFAEFKINLDTFYTSFHLWQYFDDLAKATLIFLSHVESS